MRVLIGDQGDVPGRSRCRRRGARPQADLTETAITAAAPADLAGVQQEIAQVDIVVATRFHNIICALKQAKPDDLAGIRGEERHPHRSFGLGDFCQPLARSTSSG